MSLPGVSIPSAEAPSSLATDGAASDAQDLIAAVRAVQSTLHGVLEHQALLDGEALAQVGRTLEEVERRLVRQELQVVVVGERGSGRSTLLDAIVGDRLLGGARGQSSVVTFLRRRSLPSYRARLASGKLDDFSSRVPDTAGQQADAAEKLEQALIAAEQLCRAKRSDLRRAIESRERADLDAEQARSDVAGARELEDTVSLELSSLEDEALRVDRAVASIEQHVPGALRVEVPRWAVWLWLFRALYVLLRRSLWRRYQALLAQRDELRARLSKRRSSAHDASEARQRAEAGLEPLGSGADQARAHSSHVEQALRSAESERNRLRAEIEELRSTREHHESERWRRFFSDLHEVSARPDLQELSIDYPAKLLPDDVTIIDVPGLVSAAEPEWQLIRDQADGCILVSELDRGVSEAAKQFLRQLREVVPHLLLVLTKMDQAYEAAKRRGESEPWNQVELARRIGTRRFARELGRDPNSVLSISVAAEVALSARGSELAQRFDAEIEKLFVLLRQERALMVGARAADALRRCVVGFSEAEAHAERAYRQRIATLEKQRTPEPDVFKQQLIGELDSELEPAARDAIELAAPTVDEGFVLLRRLCEQSVDACPTPKALIDLAARLADDLAVRAGEVRRDSYLELETAVDRQVAKLERRLFGAVRARYQLLHEIRRAASSSPRLGAPEQAPMKFDSLASEVATCVRSFGKARIALGASGAATGAASGALLHPWLGPLVGAALGGMLSLARRESALRQQVCDVFRGALAKQREAMLAELRTGEKTVAAAIGSAAERSLERALLQFARWIAEPLEAERQAIESERQKLLQLEQLRDAVAQRDRELERALKAAASASAGLCR